MEQNNMKKIITESIQICESCGQTTATVYTISRGLRDSLTKMAWFIERKGINVANMQKELVALKYLNNSQATNMWTHGVMTGLIMSAGVGNYSITDKGYRFLDGGYVPKYAFKHKKNRFEQESTVTFSEELCCPLDFNKKEEYWEVPNFTIRTGKIITADSI